MGRSGSEMPARLRRMALATAVTASCWPTTRCSSTSSRRTSLAISPSIRRLTGTPVTRLTTTATSSSSTSSFSICFSACSTASSELATSISRSSCGSWPYRTSDARLRVPSRSARSASERRSSARSFISWISSILAFSAVQWAFRLSSSSLRLANSSSKAPSRSAEAASDSLASATRSISSPRTRRSITSISVGIESISIRNVDAASSTRSIALSGRKRPVT